MKKTFLQLLALYATTVGLAVATAFIMWTTLNYVTDWQVKKAVEEAEYEAKYESAPLYYDIEDEDVAEKAALFQAGETLVFNSESARDHWEGNYTLYYTDYKPEFEEHYDEESGLYTVKATEHDLTHIENAQVTALVKEIAAEVKVKTASAEGTEFLGASVLRATQRVIADRLYYDHELADSGEDRDASLSALIINKNDANMMGGICQQYARLTYLVLNEFGIKAEILGGTHIDENGKEESHAWIRAYITDDITFKDTWVWADPTNYDQDGVIQDCWLYISEDDTSREDYIPWHYLDEE